MHEMKQQLSAMMDGEIDLDANPHLLYAAIRSDEVAQCWSEYHLIGDILRREEVHVDVTSRVVQQLASEPTVLAPRPLLKVFLERRFATSIAASVTAVAFVGWVAWHMQPAPTASIAQNVPAASQPNALTPEAFDQYQLAHAEYAPNKGLQHGGDVQLVTYSESGN